MPSSLPSRGNSSNINRNSPSKAPSSPQSASLGRSTHVPSTATTNISVPRRNSLGDLKIPARISQAQIGLKRDLGMVREFAASVESESPHVPIFPDNASYAIYYRT
ncbi:hypothetical protein SERLA73DRAFT_56931 [Serpula lacrymans var. lacrymans S7.3]|uniref:Uncharacterized protein n=1 Tax=Serpula lacrymans var. lacrymans (strain S7.3) TaxID=936435 RepID=F8Q3A2_SERL3|nr:hypothetical protein SERLA73DRAFT_56931 [Serpula lacrymans var. lacrymans S7.3]